MRFLRFQAIKQPAASVLSKRTVRQLTSIRAISTLGLPKGFAFYPNFFDEREQRLLLADSYRTSNPIPDNALVEGLFLPDDYYTFHSGHYDNVIRNYRETCLSSWPESEVHGLTPVLDRLRALCPSGNTQTHLLHLTSNGEILPHIDNISASGEWILGVSLGATRTLRMESTNSELGGFDIELPSGSVYLQRDDIRYHWTHAILRQPVERAMCGQRVSIMIRDRVNTKH